MPATAPRSWCSPTSRGWSHRAASTHAADPEPGLAAAEERQDLRAERLDLIEPIRPARHQVESAEPELREAGELLGDRSRRPGDDTRPAARLALDADDDVVDRGDRRGIAAGCLGR